MKDMVLPATEDLLFDESYHHETSFTAQTHPYAYRVSPLLALSSQMIFHFVSSQRCDLTSTCEAAVFFLCANVPKVSGSEFLGKF
jgi:hypothetical protein